MADTQTIVRGTARTRAAAGQFAAPNRVIVARAVPNGAVPNGVALPNGASPNGAAPTVNGAGPEANEQDQEMALYGMTPTSLARRFGRCS